MDIQNLVNNGGSSCSILNFKQRLPHHYSSERYYFNSPDTSLSITRPNYPLQTTLHRKGSIESLLNCNKLLMEEDNKLMNTNTSFTNLVDSLKYDDDECLDNSDSGDEYYNPIKFEFTPKIYSFMSPNETGSSPIAYKNHSNQRRNSGSSSCDESNYQTDDDDEDNPSIPVKRKRGRPPSNRQKICFICYRRNTPEWRKFQGVDLCNACGLKQRGKEKKLLKSKGNQPSPIDNSNSSPPLFVSSNHSQTILSTTNNKNFLTMLPFNNLNLRKKSEYLGGRGILDLSLLLLRYILSYNEIDNIDSICFSMTCRKLFNERERYLCIKIPQPPEDMNPMYSYQRSLPYKRAPTNLRSYQGVYRKSIEHIPKQMIIASRNNNPIYSSGSPESIVFMENDIVIPESIRYLVVINDSREFKFESIKSELYKSNVACLFCNFIDQSLPSNLMPSTLTFLDLGSSFNLPIEPFSLPKSLKHIRFGTLMSKFNQRISVGVFQEGLEHIVLGDSFNLPIEPGVFPKSLISLQFGIKNLPFQFARYLPPSVTDLSLSIMDQSIIDPSTLQGSIPPSIKILTLSQLPFPIDMPYLIPSGVTNLNLGNVRDIDLKVLKYCSSILQLCVGGFNNKLNQGDLPETLDELILGFPFNRKIDEGVLPSSLKRLELGDVYSYEIGPGILPHCLEYLKLGKLYQHTITKNTLPSTLHTLITYSFDVIGVESVSHPLELTVHQNNLDYNKIKQLPSCIHTIKSGYKIVRRIDKPKNHFICNF
ncbi:hypothetical protein PPL_07976 [Heterostelium album PN500]|uniref:GATA-type domain-containing protein n=1 Tax=Heterostelium pallidum (strain ATCC 26659 / Pp 5 / PN500) TaxID=670386 RepID=D3BHH4_HETP5|nr:hypothetical protein PPL_07976 [Heterostelium album PN500]EFA79151.1 hypothetical protein PPL_07976 [Heterostelium album PN500]|eukprot:XP_020431273.1 hypothetical protein PPL_07976 [Heterostelium album PN500]